MTDRQIRRMIELAKNISEFSDMSDYKLGCVIFDTHKVWALGYNKKKTSTLQRRHNRYNPGWKDSWKNCTHAEICAILNLFARWKFKKIPFNKLSILVYRGHVNGTNAMAKHCPACEDALRHYGFKHIYYTGNNSFCHEEYG